MSRRPDRTDEAPSGAFFAAHTMKPATIIRSQGTDEPIDASPVRIGRMLREVFRNERNIRAWESMARTADSRRRLVMGEDGKLHFTPVRDLVGDSLREARLKRDEHEAELRHAIDYALTDAAYEVVTCPANCRLPENGLDFIREVAEFEPPASTCKVCSGVGSLRRKKEDKKSKAAFRRINYWGNVLDDVVCAAKVRAGVTDQNDAYIKLETRCRNLLVKFGSEKQTSLEGADAEQGVRQGIMDAAMRFDPTRKEGASFNTVAYNWCRRNSRARHDYQKRAGVYAPSVEAMGTDEDGNGVAALITSSDGALGTFEALPESAHELQMDIRGQVASLPSDERAVVMCEMSGMSTVEISERLNMPTAKVRRLRDAAYEALRETLTGYVDMLRE